MRHVRKFRIALSNGLGRPGSEYWLYRYRRTSRPALHWFAEVRHGSLVGFVRLAGGRLQEIGDCSALSRWNARLPTQESFANNGIAPIMRILP